ncbi:hypothetical protein EG68_06305, partial [Paragonimus skrjabini miyazakii]
LSVTGPITDDFCDKITRNTTHVINACCLEKQSTRKHFDKIIGEYRILLKKSIEHNRWQYYRSCMNAINEKNAGCSYNTYWVI